MEPVNEITLTVNGRQVWWKLSEESAAVLLSGLVQTLGPALEPKEDYFFTGTDINRLAQKFYEATQDSEGIRLIMPMTGKAELVAALAKALTDIGVIIKEEQ